MDVLKVTLQQLTEPNIQTGGRAVFYCPVHAQDSKGRDYRLRVTADLSREQWGAAGHPVELTLFLPADEE